MSGLKSEAVNGPRWLLACRCKSLVIKEAKMRGEVLSRRSFLKGSALAATAAIAAACRAATPAPTEAPTAAPTEAPTATPAPTAAPTEAPTAAPSKYGEAPMLAELVKQGMLPPVEERLPKEPLVLEPVEEIGQYGGTWHRVRVGALENILSSRLSYCNLVRWNPDGSQIIPNLAKAYEVSEDGKVYTFYLREGLRWSDGEPFTADDLLFWYEDGLLNEELTPTFPDWLTVKGQRCTVEKVDDYTVRFVFPETHGLFLVYLASAFGLDMVVWPKHYLKDFHPKYRDKEELEKEAKDKGFEFWYQYFGDRRNSIANPDLPVVWPWRYTRVPPDEPLTAERNPYYWKVDTQGNQLPYIDRIEFALAENAETANLMAIAGQVDMQLRHMLFSNFPVFMQEAERGAYRVLKWKRGYITDAVIAPNVAHADPTMRQILGDKRFRYALSHAINREEVNQLIYLGMSEPNQVSPLPTSPCYLEEQAKNALELDLEKANALLDEMGLTERSADGYRLRPDGQVLSIVYEYAPVFGSWRDLGEMLVGFWKEIGIQLTLKEEDRSLFYQRKEANQHDMGVWTGSAEFNPLIDPRWFLPLSVESIHAIPFAQWYQSGGKTGEEPPGDLRRVQELYDEIKGTADPQEQVEIFREIVRLNKENLWVLGACTAPPEVVVVKNNFRNVPEEAISDWHLLTPMNTNCEQYFIKQG